MVQCWVEMMVVLLRPQINWWPKTDLAGTKKIIWREQRIGAPTKNSLTGSKNWFSNKTNLTGAKKWRPDSFSLSCSLREVCPKLAQNWRQQHFSIFCSKSSVPGERSYRERDGDTNGDKDRERGGERDGDMS